jgi:hypothetical protein
VEQEVVMVMVDQEEVEQEVIDHHFQVEQN